MVALILVLVILWLALGIIGAVVHGLFWLLVLAAVLFLATMVFGRNRAHRR